MKGESCTICLFITQSTCTSYHQIVYYTEEEQKKGGGKKTLKQFRNTRDRKQTQRKDTETHAQRTWKERLERKINIPHE